MCGRNKSPATLYVNEKERMDLEGLMVHLEHRRAKPSAMMVKHYTNITTAVEVFHITPRAPH